MIYLNNNTILQDVYIPRQDMLQYTTGSSGTYAEGYADGYESGETHQKNLLVTTAFTQNGEYTREDGWSGVTVDVSITSKLEEKTVVISADTTNITPSSGYDGMSAVTVDATEYGQTNYDNGFDDGFDDGYASGSTEEREKLSAVTFTANTAVTMDEGGYSAVTVNVAQTGHTDQELEDAYTSGHTDGVSEEKAKLSATTFTANTAVTLSDGGYSAVTVNVPTGSSLNVEANRPFTATSNGNYTILPSSGTVFVDDSFDSDVDRYYITVSTSGYPSTGYFELLTVEDEFDSSKGYIEIYLSNGSLEYDDDYWSGGSVYDYGVIGHIELEIQHANRNFDWVAGKDYNNVGYDVMSAVSLNVNVPQTGTSATLGNGSFSANGTYSASTDNLDGYSAITINVPTSGGSVKYLEYIETNGTQIGWDTGYNIGTDIDAKIYLDFMPISGNGYGDYWFAYYGDCAENVLFRRAGNSSSIGFMFGNNRTKIDGSNYYVVDGNRYLISLDKNGITDENTGTLLVAASSSFINSTKNLYLNCEGVSGNNQVYRCIRARYYSFRVENGNGETTLDMRPCLDGNNVPCFYDEVSQTYIYHIGNGTPIAGPVSDPSYQSGYTDGIAYQKSLLGTTAFTSNGSFSAENGYSAITVNVPQQAGVYGSKTINANGTYSASTDSLDGFSSVTVNVPTGTTQKDIVICTSGGCWFNTNYQFEYGDSVEAEHCTFGVSGAVPLHQSHCQLLAGDNGEIFRIGQNEYNLYWKYFGNSVYDLPQLPSSGSAIEDSTIVFNSTAITVGGNVLTSYTTTSSSSKARLIVFANTKTGSDVTRNQTAKIGRIKIYGSDGTLKATFEPRLDEFNVPYFKYIEENIDIYASGNTAPFYEEIVISSLSSITITANTTVTETGGGGYSAITVNVDTASTYNDGYNDGYDDAFDDVEASAQTLSVSANGTYNTELRADGYLWNEVIVNVPQTGATLGTKVITDNGRYSASTDNLDGFSSVTVNVPQSGVQIPIFFADYIHTDTLSANTYEDYIDTGLFPTDDVIFRVKGYRKGKTQGNRIVGWTPDETTHRDEDDFRLFWTDNSKSPYFDWGTGRINYVNYFSSLSGYTDITCGNYYVYDNVEEQMIVSGSQKSVSGLYSGGTIRADVGSWWLKSLEIYDGNTLLFDGVAAYDGSGNVGLYDKVSHTLKNAVTTKQMVYEFDSGSTLPLSSITFTANTSVTVSDKAYTAITVNVSTASSYNSGYTSGYTDGYDSGFTAGEENVENNAQTLSVSANGTYNTGLRTEGYLWNEVIVNVPQTGATLGTKVITDNGRYSASTDNLDGYSEIRVNVSGNEQLRYFIEGKSYYNFSFPTGTTYIRKNCFRGYDGLEGVTLRSSITGMGEYAFADCVNLLEVVKSNSHTIEHIPSHCFYNCYNLGLTFSANTNFFNNVVTIGDYAFYNCSSEYFTAVTACCLTDIGDYAFANCSHLRRLVLGDTLETIGVGAFSGCDLYEIYMLSPTPPTYDSATTFNGVRSNGYFYYPQGSDYSSYHRGDLLGWNFIPYTQ